MERQLISSHFIHNLGTRRLRPRIGSKARELHFLIRKGWQVPASYVCTWDAYERYRQDDPNLMALLRAELEQKVGADCVYAVRSSGNIEDGPQHSFAGQFKTVLNVVGTDGILKAMQVIWSAALEPGVQAYLDNSAIKASELRMAIIIQEMVQPRISGVSFSKNPLTGMDEVIVEAVEGTGDALVQEGAMPMRWVNKWGTWLAKPDVQEPALGVIGEVVQQTKAIAKQYGRPADLEWVFDGREVNWVQLREITSVEIPIYSNRISREVFPGIIKPLVWSVNVPLVTSAWVAFLTELVGPDCLEPESLVGRFYCRAYFNIAALGKVFERLGLPKESLELLMGIEVEGPERPSFKPSLTTYMLLPRLLRFGLDKARFARRIEANLPPMEARCRAFWAKPLTELTERQLLDEVDDLYPLAQETAYYNIVTALLMRVYSRVLERQLDGIGIDLEDLEMSGGKRHLGQFDPNLHLARLHQKYNELDEELQAQIRDHGYQGLSTLAGTEALRLDLEQFLEHFGHLSDSGSDFSCEPWREDPDLVLQMITNYTPVQNGDRQKVRPEELELTGLQRPFFMSVYNRARQFQWYREAASSLYTYGYGLFRDHFLELGERFVGSGILRDREDIFFLYLDEVREIVEAGDPLHNLPALIHERKVQLEGVRDLAPPDIIYGNQAPPLQPHQGEGLKGIATSRGHYTGPARILRGVRDFNKLQEGDVLVIPYSDVGWAPLFTKAGAVIAESGGMLSHSSIIAREYGIPAVVSVPSACRIADDTLVTVDGYRGQVILYGSMPG